jgi:hypothetical protein
LLGGGRPPPLEALTKRLRDLGQKLGDDHDLAMLLAARAENPLPEPADWDTLQRTVQRALRQLEEATAVRAAGRGRSRRWLAPALGGFATNLLLPGALPID